MIKWVFIVAVLGPAFAVTPLKVDLPQGPVVGYRGDDADVYSFYGIPYATAPTGRNKFKGPQPAPTWTEPLHATNDQIMCPQYPSIYFPGMTAREDCLVLNVFIPNTNDTNLPVVFHIHGGGFLIGYGNWEKPKQFVESKNLIVVTLNYRLGPHGFLCMGTEDIPGNAGIKDQVAALRWVRDNIALFRGNPDDVTIAGCSAGGASVDLHMLSKMSQGLFRRVIGQSGANIAHFAIQNDPIENALYYGEQIQFPGGDLNDLEEFYKSVSFDQLYSYSLLANKDHAVKMSPCIERNIGVETFLEESPKKILQSGNYIRYPMIYGYANMEGLFRINEFEEWRDEMNRDFTQFIPADLRFDTVEEKEALAREIKEFYFGNKTVSNETVLEYIDFISDVIFVYPMQKSVSLQVEAGNNEIYLLVYSFTHALTPYVPYTDVKGANHCDQNLAVFDIDYGLLTPDYIEMKENIRTIWNDFIRTGHPTPEGSSMPRWEPVQADRAPCMNIGRPIQMQGTYAKEGTDFWERIYERYYRHPMPPSSSPLTAAVSPLLAVSFMFIVRFVSV